MGGDFSVAVIDEKDGVVRGDGFEKVHHEFLLSGPGIDEEEIDLIGVEAVVGFVADSWRKSRGRS